jgi:hypothetical protein
LNWVFDTLKGWTLDWLHLSSTEPSEKRIEDPLNLLPRVFIVLAGIVAVFASPAITVLAPELNQRSATILRVIVAIATLCAANYVVTAKDMIPAEPSSKSGIVQRFRYSNSDRLVAQGVVLFGIVIWSLNFITSSPVLKDCDLMAVVTWPHPDQAPAPLYVTLTAGDPVRYHIENGIPIAMRVASAHTDSWAMSLQWSDGSRSEFGNYSGCDKRHSNDSEDGRAHISLESR